MRFLILVRSVCQQTQPKFPTSLYVGQDLVTPLMKTLCDASVFSVNDLILNMFHHTYLELFPLICCPSVCMNAHLDAE